jgi:hypothetical protein
MSGRDEFREHLSRWIYQFPLERNALISRENSFARSDDAVTVAGESGDVGNLIAPFNPEKAA